MQVQHELPAALLQVSKLLCLILYRNNSSKLLYNVNYHQHDIVKNNLPTATDHSAGDLAFISEHLAVLKWALSTIPTTRALLASLLPSSMVIQGRPRWRPYFSLVYIYTGLYWPILIAPCSLAYLTLFINLHIVVLLFLLLLLLLLFAAPISSMQL